MEMSRSISIFSESDYGVGVTGKLKRLDINNMNGDDDIVYISIYDKISNKYYNDKVHVTKMKRIDNIYLVVEKIVQMFKDIL